MAKEIAAAAMGKYHYIPKVRHSKVQTFEGLKLGEWESSAPWGSCSWEWGKEDLREGHWALRGDGGLSLLVIAH